MKKSLFISTALLLLLILFGSRPLSTSAGPGPASGTLPPGIEFCTEGFQVAAAQISPVGLNFGMEYEFDPAGYRALWQRSGVIRILNLNPNTGWPVGSPIIVDTGAASSWPASTIPISNGAEWASSLRGSELYYMKPYGPSGGNRQLYRAFEVAPGVWNKEALPDGITKGYPMSSKDPLDAAPRLYYIKPATYQTLLPYDVAVRDVPEDPATEQLVPAAIPTGLGGPRWITGQRRLVTYLIDPAGVEQVGIYDLDTRQFDMVTSFTASGGIDIDEPWTSDLPQLGPDVKAVWFVANGTEFQFYLKDASGSWTLANKVNPSQLLNRPNKPFILSPEPFSYQGRPYIVFQLATTASQQNQPADIYLTTPGASSACHFRLLSPDDGAVRRAPEFLELANKMMVYFLEIDAAGGSTLHIAETGLH